MKDERWDLTKVKMRRRTWENICKSWEMKIEKLKLTKCQNVSRAHVWTRILIHSIKLVLLKLAVYNRKSLPATIQSVLRAQVLIRILVYSLKLVLLKLTL